MNNETAQLYTYGKLLIQFCLFCDKLQICAVYRLPMHISSTLLFADLYTVSYEVAKILSSANVFVSLKPASSRRQICSLKFLVFLWFFRPFNALRFVVISVVGCTVIHCTLSILLLPFCKCISKRYSKQTVHFKLKSNKVENLFSNIQLISNQKISDLKHVEQVLKKNSMT